MFIAHGDASLYAVSFGSAHRTLVAHGGWAGSWELWADPFTYLSRTWRTVAYDHRGTGATVVAPVESITHENMVADLFAVLDRMEIEHCVLAAESAGAAVALDAVLRCPERFEGLVLVDGLYYRAASFSPDAFALGLAADFQATIGAFVDQCVPESEPDSAAVRRWGRQILSRSSPQAAIRLLECQYGFDLRPRLAQVRLPTLVIHGDLDAIVPLSASESLADQLPYSRLHVVRGAGHVPTITRPREVADAIENFFAAGT